MRFFHFHFELFFFSRILDIFDIFRFLFYFHYLSNALPAIRVQNYEWRELKGQLDAKQN